MTKNNAIKKTLKNIPEKIGVYQYYNKDEKLLYVGKAKNLKKRILSYFGKTLTNKKTASLIKKITDIKYVLVETEMDALLLENSLIKKYRPFYNVMLKDDKTYPWICIKKERFPRVFLTRKIEKDGSEYFGPYTSVRLVKLLLKTCNTLYPLRSCYYSLSKTNIENKKFEVCLEFHIDNCLGPCVGLQKHKEYLSSIENVRKIISGDLFLVKNVLKKSMLKFADQMNFEKAQEIKENLLLLNNYQAKSTVVNPKITNVDVFSIVSTESVAFVNYLKINNGIVVLSQNLEIRKRLNESDNRVLELAIIELRSRFNSASKKVYSSIKIESDFNGFKVFLPKIGDKKKLVSLSLRNARGMQIAKLNLKENSNSRSNRIEILTQLQKDLGLNKYPSHIECFDNSNIQGAAPVSSCVVFKNGQPNKKDYRYFNIKTVLGINDFACIQEVVYRRYKRVIAEKKPLPNLIVIDGGKGQLSSAIKSLKKLGLHKKINVIGIAKRLEQVFSTSDPLPFYLDKKSESLRLIKYLRDEAHRFAITAHRKRRNKIALELEGYKIKGVGEKTIKKLIDEFGSIKIVLDTDRKKLEKIIGKKKVNMILNHRFC